MNTITLDNSTYKDISLYAKHKGISVADALKAGARLLLDNFKAESKIATEGQYYISPKVKALEMGFKCPEGLSTDYKEELKDTLTGKYL